MSDYDNPDDNIIDAVIEEDDDYSGYDMVIPEEEMPEEENKNSNSKVLSKKTVYNLNTEDFNTLNDLIVEVTIGSLAGLPEFNTDFKKLAIKELESDENIDDYTQEDINKKIAKLRKQLATPPRRIENHILFHTRKRIEAANIEFASGAKYPIPSVLSNWQIAKIISTFHKLCVISTRGENIKSEFDLLCMYIDDSFIDTAYEPNIGTYLASDDLIKQLIREYNPSISSMSCNEVIDILRTEAPAVSRCLDKNLVPVANGIFDYQSKTLKDFDPRYVFLTKSPIKYNPKAKNITLHNDKDGTDWDVESWMKDLSDDPEIVELLWEIMGAAIRPNVRWNKSAWLYSERGNNGKGTFCALVRNICGKNAAASLSIDDFSKDFMLEQLTDASAIVNDENDVGTFIDKAANLKAVITNDVILINRKYKAPISYQFFGFMIQCLNDFPKIKDRSGSFYRRQLFVPMTKNFTGVERKYIKDEYLQNQDVLEYVLYRILHMNYYELSEPEATKDVLSEYKISNDPVREFWDTFRNVFTWDLLPFEFLYDLYKTWFKHNNPSGSPIQNRTFIKDIMTIVEEDSEWDCEGKTKQYRPKNRMDNPEPLIVNFNLENWKNTKHLGSPDISKIAVPELKSSYRGVIRMSSVAAKNDDRSMSDIEKENNKNNI